MVDDREVHDFIPVDPRAQVGYLLVRAAELVSRPWTRRLSEHGINPRQFSVLAVVAAEPGLSQAELARRALITPQSMGELLTRLEATGLVRRTPAAPGRAARVDLTDAGRRSLAQTYPVVQRLQDDSMAALSVTDRRELSRLLLKLIAEHES